MRIANLNDDLQWPQRLAFFATVRPHPFVHGGRWITFLSAPPSQSGERVVIMEGNRAASGAWHRGN
ncbi:MAG TPA: hypothetical protein VFI82_12955 [Terriglobales bacterium]|nr:hypothetical protein [Terriglobales bacterium]